MEGAVDRSDRHAGIEIHIQTHRIDDRPRLIRLHHRRQNSGSVRHHVSAGHGATLLISHHLAGDVARRHHHREAQAVAAHALGHRVVQRVLVFDLDPDLVARADVGHPRGEDVRSLLRHQRGRLALGLGFLIGCLGLRALLDFALDHPVGHLYAHAIDRRILGQRKHIGALAPVVRRVAETLHHLGPHDRATHPQGDIGVQQRRGNRIAAAGTAEQQRALLDRAVLSPRRLGRPCQHQHQCAERQTHAQTGEEHQQQAGEQLGNFSGAISKTKRCGGHGGLRSRAFLDTTIETGKTDPFGHQIGQSADQMWQKKGSGPARAGSAKVAPHGTPNRHY